MLSNILDGIHAFAGDVLGTVHAHVRPLSFALFHGVWTASTPTMAASSDIVSPLPLHPADPMSIQANDAAAGSRPTGELPPLPYRGTTPTLRPSSGAREISSPAKSSEPTRKPAQAREVKRPQLAKSRISDDEKRLIGDFRYLLSHHMPLERERLICEQYTGRCCSASRPSNLDDRNNLWTRDNEQQGTPVPSPCI